MDLREYQQHVGQLAFGKKLPTAVYVFRDGEGGGFGVELDRIVAHLVARYEVGPEFNVVKFRTDELKISFLCYPRFFEDPHPALRHAITIDLVRGKARHTDYDANPNPPILHRKEAFLPANNPKRALRLFVKRGGAELLGRAKEARCNDLLVYMALSNLRKRVPFGHLSASLRLDIRTFLGNHKRALAKGLELLYAAGDPGEIELACEDLKLGWQDAQALYLHRSLLDQLPPVLRAYVGCATALFGTWRKPT